MTDDKTDCALEKGKSNEKFKYDLSSLRGKNQNRVILTQLNISSIRNKFDPLAKGIKAKVDVLMISETKIDETFPSRQFYIEGFTPPYRLDRNCHGGGILVYFREDIPSKLIEMNSSVEKISIELNSRKKKWLVNCPYNANNSNICDHLRSLGKSLDTLLTNYDKLFLMRNFNAEEANIHIKDFCNLYKLKNLIKVPTSFKNPDNPKTIDLMLTKSVRSFQNSCALETGLSEFHKMTVNALKSYLKKKQPKIISYGDFGKFSNNDFRT